ncbi:nitrate/nitrite transporter [Branchiibius sp. NY16-3462-2]|uniref:MFS transporter n=1 Tax=Branchiibius sp. NY16-3462-2 TaxID=1807500 RepID=UPI000792342D|nr:MFS transporter [Branchiibius sp. NY16-3462-2]KYH46289.1 MFS transporter [Branchiibius sp. NY16-3462-2]
MTTPDLKYPLGGRRAYLVWGTAVSIYFLAVFHRSSLGVAGIIAAQRFHITSAQLGTFVMLQLFVYAALQVPVGALLDRFGSKVLLITGLVLMTVAQAGFAFAASYPAGLIARVVIGAGDAMIFVSVLRIVALWFPSRRAAVITQFTGLIGQIGALVAAGPLAVALHDWGWTKTFLTASLAGVLFGVALLAIVKDSPYVSHRGEEVRLRAVTQALRAAWAHPGTKLGLWCHFTSQFAATIFALIWGFPFLTAGEGLSTAMASTLLSVMVVSSSIAGPLIGVFSARFPYRRSQSVLGIVAAMAIVWTAVLLWPGRAPLWLLLLLVVVIAVGGPGSVVGFDLARTFNPPARIGSATGIVNVGGFTASLSTIWLIGVVLDKVNPGGASAYTLDGFRAAMSVQYVVWGVGVVMILLLRRKTRALVDSEDEYAHLRPLGR